MSSEIINLLNALVDAHQKALVANKDSSQAAFSNVTVRIFNDYGQKGQQFDQRRKKEKKSEKQLVESIIGDIQNYCVREFSKRHKNLKVDVQNPILLDKNTIEIYLQDPFHTAYRFFNRPNSFHKPKSRMGMSSRGEGKDQHDQINIPEEHYKLLCLFWLAVNDERNELSKGVTREQAIHLFIRDIAYMGRAHNWIKKKDGNGNEIGPEHDDLTLDDPSCSGGIRQRLDICFFPIFPKYGQVQLIGGKILSKLNGLFKICKSNIQNAFFNENKVKITASEMGSIFRDIMGQSTYNWNNDKNNIEDLNNFLKVVLEDCSSNGVADHTDNSGNKIIRPERAKIEFCLNIFRKIFVDCREKLVLFDRKLKIGEQARGQVKVYVKDFSSEAINKEVIGKRIINQKKYHNYATFFNDLILNNFENFKDIIVDTFDKCFKINDSHFYSKEEYLKTKKGKNVKNKKNDSLNIFSGIKNRRIMQRLLEQLNNNNKQKNWFEKNSHVNEALNNIALKKNPLLKLDFTESNIFDMVQCQIQENTSDYQLIDGFCVNNMSQINIPRNGSCLFGSVWATTKNNPNIDMIRYPSPKDVRSATGGLMLAHYERALRIIGAFVYFVQTMRYNRRILENDRVVEQNVVGLNEQLFNIDHPRNTSWVAFAGYVNRNFPAMNIDQFNANILHGLQDFLSFNDFADNFDLMLQQGNDIIFRRQMNIEFNGNFNNREDLRRLFGEAVSTLEQFEEARLRHNIADKHRFATDIRDYICKMRDTNIWGSDLEIKFLVELLNINISYVKIENGSIVLNRQEGTAPPNRTVSIMHCNGNHYQGLVNSINLDHYFSNNADRLEYLGLQIKDALNNFANTKDVQKLSAFLDKNHIDVYKYRTEALRSLANCSENILEQRFKIFQEFECLSSVNHYLQALLKIDWIGHFLKDMHYFNEKIELFNLCKQDRRLIPKETKRKSILENVERIRGNLEMLIRRPEIIEKLVENLLKINENLPMEENKFGIPSVVSELFFIDLPEKLIEVNQLITYLGGKAQIIPTPPQSKDNNLKGDDLGSKKAVPSSNKEDPFPLLVDKVDAKMQNNYPARVIQPLEPLVFPGFEFHNENLNKVNACNKLNKQPNFVGQQAQYVFKPKVVKKEKNPKVVKEEKKEQPIIKLDNKMNLYCNLKERRLSALKEEVNNYYDGIKAASSKNKEKWRDNHNKEYNNVLKSLILFRDDITKKATEWKDNTPEKNKLIHLKSKCNDQIRKVKSGKNLNFKNK